MNQLCKRRLTVVGLAVCWLFLGCDKKRTDDSSRSRPQWMFDTELVVQHKKTAFADNTEVFIELTNRTPRPVVIHDLGATDAAVLVQDNGTLTRIHELSVGVAKQIVVPPLGRKRTSLLFQAAARPVRALRIHGRDHPVP